MTRTFLEHLSLTTDHFMCVSFEETVNLFKDAVAYLMVKVTLVSGACALVEDILNTK